MQTKIIGGGTVTAGPELGVDPTFNAARVGIRPLDHGLSGQVLGHYRVTGTTSAALWSANAILLSFRWGDSSRFCVLQRISVGISVVSAVTAQRTDPLVITIQRSYTANETTNTTALTPSRARANMATSSLVSQVAVASAAAGISGGTRTADASPINSLAVVGGGSGLTTIGSGQPTSDMIANEQLTMHPEVLSPNEGFTIAWGGTALATGTVEVNFNLAWSEVVTF
jgi:hypothetical protein